MATVMAHRLKMQLQSILPNFAATVMETAHQPLDKHSMDYSYLLYQLGNFTWIGYVLALFLAFLLKTGSKSYYFGGLVLVIANLAMQVTEPLLVELANYNRELVRSIWYPTWAAFDLVAVYAIYLLHVRAKCTIQFESASLVISFTVMSLLQGIRYVDQFVIETNYLVDSYKISIISINLSCFVIAMLPVINWLRLKLKGAVAI